MPRGSRTPEEVEALRIQCLDLYANAKTIQEIARLFKVSHQYVQQLLSSNADDYDAAKMVRAEVLVGEMMEIVDNADPVTSSLARVRADQRKWIASKISSVYRDKQELNVSGNLSVTPVLNITSAPAPQAIDIIDVKTLDEKKDE